MRGGYGTRRRAIALVTAVAVVVLGVGAWGATRFLAGGPSHPRQWDARVLPIVQFVEHERGLKFKHAVFVDFLAPDAFKKMIGGDGKVDPGEKAELDHIVGQGRAMGLLSGQVDLAALGKQEAEEHVVGVYEPSVDRVFVRGADLTPEVRVTLAHDLTHALQDQYFTLGTKTQANVDDSAVRALIEGDAMRVESVYESKLSPEDQKAYLDAERA